MFHIWQKHWPNAVRADEAEAGRTITQSRASAASAYTESETEHDRLYYIRRWGPVMGLCLYVFHSSLGTSGGSPRGATSPQVDPQ